MPKGYPSQPLNPTVIRQIIELYKSGLSLHQVSKDSGIGVNRVYQVIQDEGIARPRVQFGRIRAPFTKEHLQNLSDAHLGQRAWNTGIPHSEETRRLLSETASQNWQGGIVGRYFASILHPLGFIREHRIYWAIELNLNIKDRQHKFFCLDFALIGDKIGIELDGPHHKTTPQEDWQRDEMLRYLGWEIFRLKHD